MNLQDDPGAAFRQAMPDTPPPPAQFDLDKIVRDGYRSRNRHRAVLGGAVTTGVAAVAAVLALSVVGFPGGGEDPNGDQAAEQSNDLAMSGYPYDEHLATEFDEESGEWIGQTDELMEVKEAATAAFGQLLVDAGVWDDPQNALSEEDCSVFEESSEEIAHACEGQEAGLPMSMLSQHPGNYGQTWLRSYTGGAGVGNGEDEDVVFRLEAMLPGGWTAEPGPFTQQVFPQHLISASGDPWYEDADWTDELVTTDLDDGRKLITVDHECAFEAAVVYPNGSGLRASWDMGCGEATSEYEISLEDFAAAMTAMPEIDYDTTGLAPVGELLDVPVGWTYDPEWEGSPEAETAAENSIEGAAGAIANASPGSQIEGAAALQLGMMDRGAIVTRSFYGEGTLPIETTIDETTGDIGFDLRYYLPGGWLPGQGDDPYLAGCRDDFTCSTTTDDDGTVWAFEEYENTVTPTEDEGGGEPFTEHQLEVTMFSPDGWAASISTQWTDDAAIDADLLGDLLRAVPAPEYDPAEVPTIPAD